MSFCRRSPEIRILLSKTLDGSILDIGGGGEGIIGRLHGARVTAIDNRQEELDEAPDGYQKLLMDDSQLTFADGSFDHVTFFYSLMYMPTPVKKQALAQAARVFKAGGTLWIWDAQIKAAWPEPFIAQLEIVLPDRQVHTGYGIKMKEARQDAESIVALGTRAKLKLLHQSERGGHFSLCFLK